MPKKPVEPSPHLATFSVRLPTRLVGRVYTMAAEEHVDPSVIAHQALVRWFDEHQRQPELGATHD